VGPVVDHDQRFKTLLREFFPEFVRLFFPQWVDRFDFARVEWLEQEVFLDPPQGKRRALDLVARLPINPPAVPGQPPEAGDTWIALVHVEIESAATVAPLRASMFDYYKQLRNRHERPVLPIALYLRVGLEGVGWDVYEEYFWEHRLVHFEYAYVGLPALDGEQHLTGANVLGLALGALMRLPKGREVELGLLALRRLHGSGQTDYRRFLLGECLGAYLPLDDAQKRQFEEQLNSDAYHEVRAMTKTWFEEGLEKGLEQGQRRMLQKQLEVRFGPLSPPVRQRLEAWPTDRLVELGQALLQAQSLRELGLEE
jgi:hypothetical protein